MTTVESAAARITVLGSVNMDLVATTERLPVPGETILGGSFAQSPGGKGSNQAIAAAKSGGEVDFLGAVGDDTFALELRETLVLNDVGTELLREVEGPSGVAFITVDQSGENSIIVVGGANSTVTDLSAEELAVVENSSTLLCQFEIPIETVTAAAKHARTNGTVVMLNPSPMQPIPAELLECVDVLVLNEIEAEQIGDDGLAGVPHVVITRGSSGATYRGPNGVEHKEPAMPVEAIDTTGAGDAFAGALAVAWNQGPERALRWACAAGALATTVRGASPSLPSEEQIQAALTMSTHS
jgi:ribokinase